MKRIRPAFLGFIVVVCLTSFLWVLWARFHESLEKGMRPSEGTLILNKMEKSGVPLFELDDLYGRRVRLEDLKDKIVIINFWASWCEPCVREFPSLVRLLRQFPDDIVLLAVSLDKSFDDLTSFMRAFKVTDVKSFVVLWDKEKALAKEYGTVSLPESYILEHNLQLAKKVAGADEWDSANAIEYFRSLVERNRKAAEAAKSLMPNSLVPNIKDQKAKEDGSQVAPSKKDQ